MTSAGPLVLRADGGGWIGNGHVMRCLALAQAWRHVTGTASWFLGELPEAVAARLRAEGMIVVPRPAGAGPADAAATLEAARASAAQAIVVDGYGFDEAYQFAITSDGFPVLWIDDYGHCDRYVVQAILNPNLHADPACYRCRPPSTSLFLGPRFAPIRLEFLAGYAGWRSVPEIARRVLVTVGGTDPRNVSGMILCAFRRLMPADLEVQVVVGPGNPHAACLAAECRGLPDRVTVLRSVDDMAPIMTWADLAITAAGSTCWELAFMGVPMITIATTDNQRPIAASLAEAGAAVSAGWIDDLSPQALAELIEGVRTDRPTRQAMRRIGRSLIDGLGARRVAEVVASTTLAGTVS